MSEVQVESKKPAREVTVVTMTDGRKVEFAGKRQMLKETFFDHGKASVRFDFRNGETRTFHVPHDALAQYAAHGASQKIGDETAGVDDVDDMVVAVDEIISRLEKGEWSARKKTGDSFSGASIVIRAICEATGKSVAEVKNFLEAKLAENPSLTRRALYASFRSPTSKTGAIIARLEAEKASKSESVHADDLLAEIGE